MRKFIWLWFTPLMFGQQAVSLSLLDAVRQALAAHPLLESANQKIAVARGDRLQAGLSTNPQLVIQTENLRAHGDPPFRYSRDVDQFAYLQKTFETAGKRGLRAEVASYGVRRAELELELLRKQIAARVSAAYWSAAGAKSGYEMLLEAGENLHRIIEYHEVRVKEGAMAEADLLRVRLEGERMQMSMNQALLEAERARIQLFREMGSSEFPRLALTDRVETEATPVVADAAASLEQRSEVKIARLEVERGRSQHRLQQANSRPDLTALFGLKRTGGMNTMLGAVQVELPFQNRNQGAIASAAAEIRMAESSLAAGQALVKAEVQAAGLDYEMRRKQLAGTLAALVKQAEEGYRIAEAAYREGGVDLLRLLDAQRVRNEAISTYLRSLTELRLSRVNLDLAMGVDPQ